MNAAAKKKYNDPTPFHEQRTGTLSGLTRQRERLSTETHRQLHSLVRELGTDINRLLHSSGDSVICNKTLAGMERRSEDIKSRLRTILGSLERPMVHNTISELLGNTARSQEEYGLQETGDNR